MRKASLNSKGFGLVAVLLVAVVLAVISGAGAYVYHKNHKTKTITNTSTTNTSKGSSSTQNNTPTPTPVDPYIGWTTGTLGTTGLTFKYPSSWVVQDTSECGGAHNFTVDAPSSEVQGAGFAQVSHYGLSIIVNASVAETAKCAPSASSLNGLVLGPQSKSTLINNGALKGKYVVINGDANGADGTLLLGGAYGPGQKVTETGVLSVGGTDLQITSSLNSGQQPVAASISAFLDSQLYKETLNILNSLTAN